MGSVSPYHPLPLIINDIKSELGLFLNEYTTFEINGAKFLRRHYKGADLTLKEFAKFPYPFYDINDKLFAYHLRRCLAFRYIFFLTSQDDESVYISPVNKSIFCEVQKRISVLPISKNETAYDVFDTSLPKYIIDRYFDNSMDIFNEYVQNIISNISPEKIVHIMTTAIKRYDSPENYREWIEAVAERFKCM